MYTIRELADLAGVTTRTLRWYDSIGLLRPEAATPAGYRLYGEAAAARLQQILFYRELEVPLREIKAILDDPGFDCQTALQSHLEELTRRKERTEALILTVRKTLNALKGEVPMTDQERFEAFKANAVRENEARYGNELREKYGDGAVDQANADVMRLTLEEYRRWKSIGEEILDRLSRAVPAGEDPAGQEGQAIAQLHRAWCSFTMRGYDPKRHAGLAELYVQDQRLTAYYDRDTPGCARFLRDAIVHYTSSL